MRSFFKIFLASLSAILLVIAGLFFLGIKTIGSLAGPDIPEVKANSVLVLELNQPVMEQGEDGSIGLPEGRTPDVAGLFDMVRALKQAASDSLIKGIYISCSGDGTGYAGNEELRSALLKFKASGKFIYAYGQTISERGYELASVADKIYIMPLGTLDWNGYGNELTFFKGALDKLEVTPEIFYAGQFKSATEPFRLTKMSDPSRLQLTSYVEDVYKGVLQSAAVSRRLDTAVLRGYANTWAVKNGDDAASFGLITASKYDDEVKDEIKGRLGIKPSEKINMISMLDYIKNKNWNAGNAKEKMALIYAEGEIVEGTSDAGTVGGETYSNLVRKARLDKNIKAVVLRVNSPGGSVLASEAIWREVSLCKKEKPVVVSMGDYAASGGYYISCAADSIFAQPKTLTGSIGVFMMFFDVQRLFNNKLGITFDGVKTGPFTDFGTASRSMTSDERRVAQAEVESIYHNFLQRVANGRHLSIPYVDSIAQGRIWSGDRAKSLKLVDALGSTQDAIDCAARMAKLKDYQLREWPVVRSFWEKIAEKKNEIPALGANAMKQEIGAANFELLGQFKKMQTWVGVPQMRLPFFSKTY